MQKNLNGLIHDTASPLHTERGNWMPLVDVRETDGALVAHAELPGIERKDIKVDVTGGLLIISGERHYEKEMKEENVLRVERSYGSFSRSFSLPDSIDGDKATASLKDGVLEVKLPKKEITQPRTKPIEIK